MLSMQGTVHVPRVRFRDRRQAGRRLAAKLDSYRGLPDLVVLALPRGGVPVGYEVAHRLGASLDVQLVRKLGVPGHEEFAMGAIAAGAAPVIDWATVHQLGITDQAVAGVIERERRELERRAHAYVRPGETPPPLRGRTVILTDDGLATGATMMAAVAALRSAGAERIVVAVPVAASQSAALLRPLVDDFVCVIETPALDGVGRWYDDFTQTSDEEVQALLTDAHAAARNVETRSAGRP